MPRRSSLLSLRVLVALVLLVAAQVALVEHAVAHALGDDGDVCLLCHAADGGKHAVPATCLPVLPVACARCVSTAAAVRLPAVTRRAHHPRAPPFVLR